LAEEEELLRELQDKNSPQFHKFLSQEEWNARFAPSREDEQAVVDWAKSQGLTVTQRYPNRLLVDVEAPVASIEKALNVSINHYQLGNKLFYSNDRDPSLPAHLAHIVQSVLGLNNLEVAHHSSVTGRETLGPDYAPGPVYVVGEHRQGDGDRKKLEAAIASRKQGLSPYITGGAYDPSDIYSSQAYDYRALQNLGHCCNPLNHPNNSPPESSIAIVIWDDFSMNDVQGFLDQYPYLASNIQKYLIDGTPLPDLTGEVTMDTEWTTATANSFHSMADTAKVNVYEGANSNFSTLEDAVNQALTDGYARVLSMSWGAPEHTTNQNTMKMFHNIFVQMVGEGWTLVVSSGDAGATNGCGDYLSVSWPASDPDITAAGGTTLTLNSDGTYSSEVGWTGGPDGCVGNDGGSTGGCSSYFTTPPYQGNTACGSYRSVPDIALNADGYYEPQNIYFQGQLQYGGGTSIVAPEMAGFFAQENAYLLALGNICGASGAGACAPIGDANNVLYKEGMSPYAPHYPFYDITSGCNNNDITQKYGLTPYCASAGLDQVTGWGSANMLQLAWAFNAYFAFDSGPPVAAFSGPPINRWYNTDEIVSWTVTDTSGNGRPPNGVAGSSAAWDIDPGDPYSEPTPGSGNSFYSGPQFPNGNGNLGLAKAVSQGWHTVNLRAWDNSGFASAVLTYGPLGYDTTPPVTTATLGGTQQGGVYVSPVQVTLAATDNLSGVAATYSEVDGGAWQIYTGSFTVTANGNHVVGLYSVDLAGNVETTRYVNFTINLSNTYYTLSVYLDPVGAGTVTSTDGSINCPGSCGHSYLSNTRVALNASPAQGGTFTGWRGACRGTGSCKVTMTRNLSLTATFTTPGGALQFIPVVPCRVVDTRNAAGPFGGPPIQGQTERDFSIPPSTCNIPSTAAAYSLNLTVVPPGPLGYVTIWPTGEDQPVASTLNSVDGRVKANAAIVPAGYQGAVSVFASNTTDVVLDIDGYFAPVSGATLAFYTLPPCRVADTRPNSGFPQGLGPPSLSGGVPRDFPILSSDCFPPGINPQAYSFNFTAVPPRPLGYLTVWPADQQQPTVSTLNDVTGTVVANAAIVPASKVNGDINAYVSNNSDLVIDVNGYFAAPEQGGLSLYAVTPCRVLDTRNNGIGQFVGKIVVDTVDSVCAPSSLAQAYVFNATVVPSAPLGYLTLWPDGGSQPVVSTLNAIDGAVTSNMAIVPTMNGSIDAFASNLTQLILDISAYFAP